ncbi:hypothetical protein [Telmatospirillum siberiense]|uniref:Uncharacterized protein n=1 Tax=Telmatospirillum siberiense TaxID=382514 RepID=A0A2N3PML9_9PROT|nr:hypothetical protein [Telmatospirillum siberiense]PKU21645.1 hypothetical protein CWS72_25605 [Telmatospirillum siberiense]
MFKFIGRALAGLVLTKDAQKVVGQIQLGTGGDKTKSPFAARDQAIAEAQKGAQGLVTPDRAELIRQAMQVRAAKQKILADLDDETRGKLVATAMKALLKEDVGKDG